MIVTTVFASALAAAAAEPASGPASEPPPPRVAAPAPAPQGIISYPPDFFADARPANAFEMLQRVPGFTVEKGENVRGFEGAAGNVLIDGQRPAAKSDNIEDILRRIPASQVARIDLIRGGAPGIDMQGKTVLANVIRRTGAGAQGLIAVTNNSVYDGRNASAVRLEGSAKVGRHAVEGSLVAGEGIDDGAGDGPRVRLDADGDPLILSEVDAEGNADQLTVTGAYESRLFAGAARINGRLFRNAFDYEEVNRIVFPAPAVETTHEGVDEQVVEVGGRWNRDFGARTSLELVALQQNATEDIQAVLISPGRSLQFQLDSRTGESIGRGVLGFRQNERLSWEAGGEGAFNWLESETRFVQNGVPIALPAADVRVEEARGELFGKAVWRPTSRWTAEGGLRAEGSAISSEGDVTLEKTLYFLKPRAALAYAPNEATQLRLRVERVVGQLDFDDFVASSSLNTGVTTAGNPDLEPEQEWLSEVAVERRFWNGGAVVVALRHSILTDAIDRAPIFTPDGVFDAPSNIGEGTRDEVAVNLTLPFERLGLRGAQLAGEATWRWSEVTDPTTGEEREISGLRPLEWEARFTHDLPRWRMSWGVNAFGAWRETYYRFDEIETIKLKTYVVPYVEWKPRADLSILAEIRNVTERGLRRTRYVYEGPRHTSPLAYVEDRDLQFGRMYYIRVRKTFG